jgi:hypothetical protein
VRSVPRTKAVSRRLGWLPALSPSADYVLAYRVRRAASGRFGRTSRSSGSVDCNFDDPNSFDKAFRRRYGEARPNFA